MVVLALALTQTASADRIELNDGSVLHGRLLSAENGLFRLETTFAGVVVIAQEHIRSFTTDSAVHVGLRAGTEVLGTVAPAENAIVVQAADGRMMATPTNIVAVWRPGEDSPQVKAAKAAAEKARRSWAYEASAAITGRSGGSDKFAANVGLKATLEGAEDKLIFFGAVNRAEENGNQTANDWRAGVDYSAHFSRRAVWYARTDLTKDKIKGIDLRSNSAVGFGHKFVKNDTQDTEFRLGLGYTYETYTTGAPDFESAGLDVAFLNEMKFPWVKMNNRITWTPSFEDFGNYRLVHETTFDLPLATGQFWKLRMGVTNDYQSEPPAGVEKLDTIYFTALILNWK